MQNSTLAQLIERTQGLRTGLEAELSSVTPEESGRGAIWSIADIVRHINGRGPRLDIIQKVVAGEQAAPPARFNPEAAWRRNINTLMENMDYVLNMMQGMKESDLDLTVGEGDNVHTVRGMLEFTIDHYAEHRDEIKRLRASATAAS